METKHKVLVVDDEPLIQSLLEETLKRHSLDVAVADKGLTAIKHLQRDNFDLVITDVKLPDVNGMEILREAQKLPISPGVIMITAYGTVKHAVEAMKEGAYDYITKPFEIEELEITLEKYFRVRYLEQENTILRREIQQDKGLEGIIGKSAAMQKVFDSIRMVAPSSSTVLIRGESGTGKELVARAIHQLSPRKNKTFVSMNCASLPEALVESELFGYEKGAFTGAVQKKEGRFKLAHKGTILLDEISEMGVHLQAKLLRVLQEKELETLGGTKTEKIDVRVIATTNRDLEEMVDAGQFREDLFYRLNVVPIYMPPLRERKEDIPFLVQHFIKKIAAINERKITGVDPEVFTFLANFDWPGNVRQLENIVERAIVTHKDTFLTVSHFEFLNEEMRKPRSNSFDLSRVKLRELEKKAILDALDRFKGNRTKTASQLGISVRTLRNKLREYKNDPDIDEKYARWIFENREDNGTKGK